jgi:hypothetical protein
MLEYTLPLYLKAFYDPEPNWDSVLENHQTIGNYLQQLKDEGWRITSTDGAWIFLVTTDREIALKHLDNEEVVNARDSDESNEADPPYSEDFHADNNPYTPCDPRD